MQSTSGTQEHASSGSGSTVHLDSGSDEEGLSVPGKRNLNKRAIVSESDSDTPEFSSLVSSYVSHKSQWVQTVCTIVLLIYTNLIHVSVVSTTAAKKIVPRQKQ